MSASRYRRTPRIKGGIQLGTTNIISVINSAAKSGRIATMTYVVKENERLDHLAGRFLGNGELWWVIAATSGIGWWLQVVPGTRLKIPVDVAQVMAYIG